ncbi:MAG: NAD-glutamate dehydrogenase [Dichotomicrobium sp.]
MASAVESLQTSTLEYIISALDGAPPVTAQQLDADNLRTFTRLLYGNLNRADLSQSSPEELAALARETFALFVRREKRTANIRVSRAATGPRGSSRTVIQIVNDDMPFLVDSVLGEILDRGLKLEWIAHPILHVGRDQEGNLRYLDEYGAQEPPAEQAPEAGQESVMVIQLEDIASETERHVLEKALGRTLDDVRAAVEDWKPMLARFREVVERYKTGNPPVPDDEREESIRFLEWISDRNFVFLGMRNYRFDPNVSPPELAPDPESGLGVLRDINAKLLRQPGEGMAMRSEAVNVFMRPEPLIITKGNLRSRVHRRVNMDTISLKLYDQAEHPVGEVRVAGLLTASAYTRSVEDIPFLRRKAKLVLDRSGFPEQSHSWRALRTVLDTYPRDELFQIDVDTLLGFATEILSLELKPQTRAFVRYDTFGRFASILVYVARDRFSTQKRERICEYLAEVFGGEVTKVTPFFTNAPLVRLHVVIWRTETQPIGTPPDDLDDRIEDIVRSWREVLRDRLNETYGARAGDMIARYADAFSGGYEEYNKPDRALADIVNLEKLTADSPIAVEFCRDETCGPGQVRVTLYQLDEPISLSRRVPIFENMGFAASSERTFTVEPYADDGRRTVYVHDILLEPRRSETFDITALRDRLENGFLRTWYGDAVNDAYNGLILRAGLTWREAAVFRAYGSYLRQIGAPFGQAYLAGTLQRHITIAQDLIALFHRLFDPDVTETDAETPDTIVARIEERLEDVSSLDEDRILRRFLNMIRATVRTNFYKAGPVEGAPATIAFKLASRQIEGLPLPHPFAEIFVHSPRVEGVHLRSGPIARGGIRWSDRAQDFRTEVLGLAKAQQVKNAVIIPQGAKGGFYPRRLPADAGREARMEEGVACYKQFISSLLSVTDNLDKDDRIVPPERTVRRDGDDAYLVVAADKGTATFSDIANGIAQEHGFWLDDAFASGGSAGYDHKKMGITARGAWEAVKRHFRELNHDIQTQPFTVIGVGDMSGDVFGNGMLLSHQTRLLAAFDHRDIFIDPDPDPATSWAERKRLFDLVRVTWQDYDKSLISRGGGVFSRSAKSIPLTPEIRQLTGLNAESATPNDLIRAILKMEADLLWFGGIGTFVRADGETNAEVNDRANDATRVAASELRVKAIGEGANLGITQRARIGFAMRGGKVNTDAIDNSAGVNSSDFEVNIKIALGKAEKSGRITREQRNEVLVSMTDEVAEDCLRNNYLQTLALSLGARRGLTDLGFQARLMEQLEQGSLNREVEDLPGNAEIRVRGQQHQPLTRPELAVLLAYAKIDLYDVLIDSPVCRDPHLSHALQEYFPETLRSGFADEIEAHPLRREIIATQLANDIINRGGSTFVIRLIQETGQAADEIAYGFATAMESFDFDHLYDAIDAIDNRIDGGYQLDLYLRLQDELRRQTAWFLRHGKFAAGLEPVISRYRDGVARISDHLQSVLPTEMVEAVETVRSEYASGGVPDDLAGRLARLGPVGDAPDIILAAGEGEHDLLQTARVYYQLAAFFRVDALRRVAEELAQSDYYDRLAVNTTLELAAVALRALTLRILAEAQERHATPDFEAWQEQTSAAVSRTRDGIVALIEGGEPTLAKLTVAVAQLRDLAA